MSIPSNDLAKLFPKASPDFLRLNGLTSPTVLPDRPRTPPVVERHPRPRPLAKGEAQEADSGRFLVRVTSFRVRLLDEDNLCEKYHVDLLRYAGVIPEDTAARARIETTQKKVRTKAEERVEIQVYRLSP